MNISDWLDEKEAEGLDVSHIMVPHDLLYDSTPNETIFSWKLICAESIAPAIIRSQLSSGLDTGIMPEVKTRKLVFTRQEWSGGCLPRIGSSLSRRPNHT